MANIQVEGHRNLVATCIVGTIPTQVGSRISFQQGDFAYGVKKTLIVYNQGEPALTNFVVRYSPTGDGNWGTLNATSFQTLGSAVQAFAFFDAQPFGFVEVFANVASGSIATVNTWWV